MTNSFKIVLGIILLFLIVNFFLTCSGNSNLKSIRKDLEEAKLSTDSAINELKFSQNKLDSIMVDIVSFKASINNIQTTVALTDAEKRIREEKDMKKVAAIKKDIARLKEDMKNDSLPIIDEIPIKKNN